MGDVGTSFDSLGYYREAAHPILSTTARFFGVPRIFLARYPMFVARRVDLLVPSQVRPWFSFASNVHLQSKPIYLVAAFF